MTPRTITVLVSISDDLGSVVLEIQQDGRGLAHALLTEEQCLGVEANLRKFRGLLGRTHAPPQ